MEGKCAGGSKKAEEARKDVEEAEKKKKVNEEAKRRRKSIEDKRAVEEQERKRKAEQDRKIAEDALKIKEAERQRNTEAQRDGCTYKTFLNCNPAEFHEDSDPVIVTNWLKEIEDIFEISECSSRQRVKYASHLLKGEARHWWDMIKIAHGDDVASVIIWEKFKDLVMENYCPQGLLEEEFLKLQQNDMTVPKYIAKFNEKARFAKYQVATEERKIKRYIWGLRARIRGPVQQARPSTFQEAVELALMVEKENNRQLKEEGDNKRKRENRDDDMKRSKPIVVKWRMLESINHAPYARKNTRGNVGMTIVIIVGSQATRLKNVKLSGFVLNAKVRDIRLFDCPERKPQEAQEKVGYNGKQVEYKDTQPRKTMGRVFQLTAENA
uniref:Zinc finger, CCHC-type, retrotransposon Gag domain protein n=1 Tax=Tanacetum cinerariifolium TaxID=118510 RepID=A0A699GSQ7_TANCI|nr:zinc finger, CCHC-type, retrotransposon Gag domain protein [Tanacetum cinerariifolium]